MHIVRIKKLGLSQERREAFTFLENAGYLDPDLAHRMRAMVGFRNVAVHDYQKLSLDVVRSIVEKHLDNFRRYTEKMIRMSG